MSGSGIAAAEQLSKSDTLGLRKKHLGPSCSLFFEKDPLKIVRAEGQYMYDEDGRQYLDCINNVCHVGHCNKRVVEAACQQLSTLNTNSRFLYDNLSLYARKLCSLFPDPLSVVFFTNSGSEATDLALRLARAHTDSFITITLEHAYHGHVTSAMEVSPYKCPEGKMTLPPYVHVAPCPDSYRGKHRDADHGPEELGRLYAKEVKDICEKVTKGGDRVGAFIAESMQSCGGQIIFPPDYLRRTYECVREAGGVCIADEVQIGFGRVGTHWWAFETQGVVPDIVTLGKPIGNGHPLSAVVTTPEIAKSFHSTGIEFFSTFGGNPVSCAIGMAVIKEVEDRDLKTHAKEVGDYLVSSLRSLMPRFPMIGDVRGIGLFVGIDLVRDRELRTPATEEARRLLFRLRQEGVILSLDGPYDNVLKFKPPMTFSKANVDRIVLLLQRLIPEIKEDATAGFQKKPEACNALTADKPVSHVECEEHRGVRVG